MKVYGIDFTSRPTRSKPITCLECRLDGNRLEAGKLLEWRDFVAFERGLRKPGPWIAGIDFPFGQSRKFIDNIGWPDSWRGYVEHARSLGRKGFRSVLDGYRANRPSGDKEHRRATDIKAGSISPQKLYGTPVGLMFFEGAARLLEANVTIPGLLHGDPQRIVIEAYPGVLARSLIGRRSYKQDTKQKQTQDQYQARKELLEKITAHGLLASHGLVVTASGALADDPGADHLDAMLCAVQAGWAWMNRENNFGATGQIDPLEGWIADPSLYESTTL
jgi:hypothetical protein